VATDSVGQTVRLADRQVSRPEGSHHTLIGSDRPTVPFFDHIENDHGVTSNRKASPLDTINVRKARTHLSYVNPKFCDRADALGESLRRSLRDPMLYISPFWAPAALRLRTADCRVNFE
jgi:hypothetical protein